MFEVSTDMSIRTLESLNNVISEFLKRNKVFYEDSPWEIRKSTLGGFGVFAKRDIEAGELIFLDCPVIFGPRCVKTLPTMCVNCFGKGNFKYCENNCDLPICSDNCQNSYAHQRECKLIRQMKSANINGNNLMKLLQCLTPIRSLLLGDEDKEVIRHLKFHNGGLHGHEIDILSNELSFEIKDDDKDFLKFVCSVLDANAFEVITGDEDTQSSLRGLYPLGSLANHCCFPNSMHVFDDKQRMVVRSAVFIYSGSEICHSYSRIIWGTNTRIYHLLNTKHFICKCERCTDPTEFLTYMSAIYCSKCKGRVIPLNPLKSSNWMCEDCKGSVSRKDVGRVMTLLGSVLRALGNNDFHLMYKFLNSKVTSLVPENNQIAIELKYKMIWILGYTNGFTWKELPIELLCIKRQFCEDILRLLEQLRTGQCKMRGLLLYELHECIIEIISRGEKANHVNQQGADKFLREAANILMYDVSAPDKIKKLWRITNGN